MSLKRPYYVDDRGMLQGPLNQPGDLSDIPDKDGFVEFVNDIYEKGFAEGFRIRGDPDEYEIWCRTGNEP